MPPECRVLTADSGSARVRFDYFEEGFTITGQLAITDSQYAGEVVRGRGAEFDHLPERRVVEYDVGRDSSLASESHAQRAEGFPKSRIGRAG